MSPQAASRPIAGDCEMWWLCAFAPIRDRLPRHPAADYPPRRLSGVLIGALLIFAAAATASNAAIEIRLHGAWGLSEFTTTAVTLCEFLLGAWLISGWRWSVARFVGVVCFLAFAVVSAVRIAAGESSCGCFGAIRLSPRLAFGLDVIAIALLRPIPAFNSARGAFPGPPLAKRAVGAASLCAGLALALFFVSRDQDVAPLEIQVGRGLSLLR
ncbi:MAG: MauE/DoxX family redox-associated membrane protein, partial [Candidatus Saccharimonadales bacterium]